jgi:predicted metal-dependent peptidase
MPSTYSEAPEELLLAIDASGSISNRYLSRFLGEMKSIAETVRPKRVRVLYWDTKVCRDELYEFDDIDKLVTSTKPSGGGGTAVSCVSRYMSEFGIKPQAVIVLTDGYLSGDWGTWNAPVLWCIANNKNARPTVGKHVHVKI